MKEISNLEMLKRDDILFQVIDDEDEDLLDEMTFEDDEEEYYGN